ncbi:hypothetical protein AGLY_015229, partial [Aphis glycines]
SRCRDCLTAILNNRTSWLRLFRRVLALSVKHVLHAVELPAATAAGSATAVTFFSGSSTYCQSSTCSSNLLGFPTAVSLPPLFVSDDCVEYSAHCDDDDSSEADMMAVVGVAVPLLLLLLSDPRHRSANSITTANAGKNTSKHLYLRRLHLCDMTNMVRILRVTNDRCQQKHGSPDTNYNDITIMNWLENLGFTSNRALFANCCRRRLRTGRRRRTSAVFSGRHDGASGQIGLMRSESDLALLLAADRRVVVRTKLPPPPTPSAVSTAGRRQTEKK